MQAGAGFHEGDADADGGEHAGVFDTDDPPTDDDHAARERFEQYFLGRGLVWGDIKYTALLVRPTPGEVAAVGLVA